MNTVPPGKTIFSFIIFIVLASLDNAASGILPPLYGIVAQELQADESALGWVTAAYILIVAISAAFWGYRGDKGQRKQLLFYGTLLWGGAMFLSGLAQNFGQLLLWQLITAVGVGSIASIGFSVISDIIPAHRRGFALSLWSISQGLGGAFGALLASTVGAIDWRWPFWSIAALGLLFALLYLLTPEPKRGQAEPELAPLFAAGHTYHHRISRADIKLILSRRTNIWLITQGFFTSLSYGSTTWIPRWAIARVQAEGFDLAPATLIGNLFVTLFGVGYFASILAGHLGDTWQRQYRHGRTTLAAVGQLGAIPFFITLFFLPLTGVQIPTDGSLLQIIGAVLASVVTNRSVALAFIVALAALSLFAVEPPNWAALLTDVNLPEHRGTIIGFSRLSRALGNAISVGLTGVLITSLSSAYPSPTNYAIGLSFFQLFTIPAGLCYILIARIASQEITAVKQTLTRRATQDS